MSRTVFITGASSGFGLLIARTQLGQGDTVLATMRDPKGRNVGAADELRGFADESAGTVHVLELDVTSDDSVERAVHAAIELGGGIDVLVNNAGIGAAGFSEAFSVAQYEQIFQVNVFGVQRVCRAALPAMRQAGQGLLLFVSSIMGRIVLPFSGPYTASKWALEGLAESYRYELSNSGVDVAIVEPGGFPTGIGERLVTPADEERVESYGDFARVAEQMWAGFGEMLEGSEAPDPQVVADAVMELIETPPGHRPLRVVVDPLMGGEPPADLNTASDRMQAELLHAMGLAGLLSVPARRS